MNELKECLGPLWPDKDAVSHESYHDAKAALRELKDQVIKQFAHSEYNKIQFEKVWLFDD